MTLKLAAELPMKQSLGCATEAGHGMVPASWLERGRIHRPSLKGPFNRQSGAMHDTKCSSTKHVLQRSSGSLFLSPPPTPLPRKQNRCLPCSHFRRTIPLKEAASACGTHARRPGEDEGNLCAIISNAERLFDMEMAEVTVRLVLKALSNLH